ncbi:efflux RND transporter periplasmic adaptor subunit [Epibacterium ulvae]|uniref:efflux RND transporter periplasmic adaptor subunit n=1 Tax=Epibacterium ulvae TaxID=1156985 RepID=UPI002491E180|nr:HlyD family efflux transporter periplasmic adaptor subunit [Epibacterium ulvae]
MRFLRQSITGLFFLSLACGLLAYAGQLVFGAIEARFGSEQPTRPQRERVFAVNVVTIDLQDIAPDLQAFGRIDSRRRLELRMPVSGRVIELSDRFEEGGSVAKGDVLVRLDPANARATLAEAEADLQDAHAEAREAERALGLAREELQAAMEQAELRQRAYERQNNLRERGVGTEATVETAEIAAAQARQAVISRRQALSQSEARIDQSATSQARATIAVESAERDVADTTVVAGFSGTLQEVQLVEGRLISANEKLADLIDPRSLEVSFRVSTAQYARLLGANGALLALPVTVNLDAADSDLRTSGQISRDSGAAGEGQSGRLIFARLSTSPGFKPGDFVSVSVKEPMVNAVARVPSAALGADGTVLALGDDDRLERLAVELVRRQGDDILIRGVGIAGRDIVAARTPVLGTGIRVRPLRMKNEALQVTEPEMIELSEEQRARLVAFVEGNTRMPAEAKARVLGQLTQAKVPATVVNRIESRMGG